MTDFFYFFLSVRWGDFIEQILVRFVFFFHYLKTIPLFRVFCVMICEVSIRQFAQTFVLWPKVVTLS